MNDTIRRQSRYTVTPEALTISTLSDRAVRLWLRLDRYAGDKESSYPARATLAKDLRCSIPSVDRAMRELVDTGWLHKERRTAGGSNLYTLLDDPASPVTTPRITSDDTLASPVKHKGNNTEGGNSEGTAAAAIQNAKRDWPSPAAAALELRDALAAADSRLVGLRLGDRGLAAIKAQVDVHGIPALVRVAVAGLHEPVPTFIQAFVPTWDAMSIPVTPRELRVCLSHPDQPPYARFCPACRAEEIAG